MDLKVEKKRGEIEFENERGAKGEFGKKWWKGNNSKWRRRKRKEWNTIKAPRMGGAALFFSSKEPHQAVFSPKGAQAKKWTRKLG